jgi:hypothetical protein
MSARTVASHCRPKKVLVGVDFGDASVLGACDRPVVCMPPFEDESETDHDH